MKPHALRRLLTLVNAVLGLGAAGLLAWYLLEVRPAVGEVVGEGAGQLPARYQALLKDYEDERKAGLKWAPRPPVSEEEMRAVVLREDYRRKRPPHWIFSGPLPPPDLPDAPPEEVRAPAPSGLEALGKPSFVVYGPPDQHTVSFRFSDGTTEPFRIGEFFRKAPSDPARFRFKDLVEVEPFLYELRYEVLEGETVVREAALTYDSRPQLPDVPWMRSDAQGPLVPAPGEPAGGAAPAGGAPGAPADGAGATPDPGTGPTPAPAPPGGGPIVIVPGGERAPEGGWKLTDLKPEIERVSYSQRVVKFDERSRQYFRGKNADSIARSVKTQVATDEKTGRTLGLRITGFDQDAPADVFDIKRGDILVSINDRPVTSREDVIAYLQGLKDESVVKVVVDRNGKLITYMVDPRDPHVRRNARYFENLK